MIGKFSRIREINQLHCARLLPNINDRYLSLQRSDRTDYETGENSQKRDKGLTLERLRERLRREIRGARCHTIGTV